GVPAKPYTIQSSGGLMGVDAVSAAPVRTCVSGPAAGVIGASEVGRGAGFSNLITFDVGGTSTDVSLTLKGKPQLTSRRMVAGYPVRTPMIDITVIGAGGGSIATVDEAGALKVGPRSAGADPGPAAYGKGGANATITDANLCLGRLDPSALLGGGMPIDLAAARTAVKCCVAEPLGLSLEDAAHGILRIANANMSRAIRSVSVERGHDLKDFALCAYGGAGPLHAAEVADECGLSTVLVPQEPGTLCARGMLLTDVTTDLVRSTFCDADEATFCEILTALGELVADGDAWLDNHGVPAGDRRFETTVDARHQGQNFEISVGCDDLNEEGFAGFLSRFHAAHRREYGYALEGRAVEFVNARVRATGLIPRLEMAGLSREGSLQEARVGTRCLYLDGSAGFVDAPVYRRDSLPPGEPFEGPAIIEEMSATTLVLAGQTAELDLFGNLIMTLT
ncbi:MAG: hydantoinase/oxoprolinase family protein, partial [Pseudomonadota bacterium]